MGKSTSKDVQTFNNKKKKSLKLSPLKIAIFVFVSYFIYNICEQQIQINKYNSQIEMYTSEINAKKDQVEYYKNQKSSIDSVEYIENVARESLGYVKPYEKIFVDTNK